jgi:phospholipid/cholesterol/gamma-HCH transport system permease protein
LSDPLLSGAKVDDQLELAAQGSWTAAHGAEIEALVEREAVSRARSIRIDMGGVDKLDTFGAWVLERLSRRWSVVGARAIRQPARSLSRAAGRSTPPRSTAH